MRKFYEELKTIEDFSTFDRTVLLDYIHRQKFEASAVCGLDAVFWVELDYILHLMEFCFSGNSDEKKEFFATNLFPLMKEKISVIKTKTAHLPEKEFFYLKKDLKTFEHIFAHASNIINKNLKYFLPSQLFLTAIESMTVLYPLCENTCDAGTIKRGDYAILLTRYVAADFSKQLVDIIDYFIWVQAVFDIAYKSDRQYFRTQIIKKLSDFTATDSKFETTTDYSAKNFVLELHEVLTEINIKSNIVKLLNKIISSEFSISECLKSIASIFIDVDKIQDQTNVLRDLHIASDLASSVIRHIKEGNNRSLYEDSALAKALKPYFMQVSRYMLDAETDIEICRLFEIMSYIDETAPSFIMHNDIVASLEKSIAKFEMRKTLANASGFDKESAELFKAKARQIYSGK